MNAPTNATISIATPETDAALAKQERAKGAEARRQERPRSSCPWHGGLTMRWWLEGYDSPFAGAVFDAQ